MKSIFEGTGVALVTPFKKGKIDYENLEKIIELDIQKQAKAIVILATTGEGTTISFEEKKQMIKFCKNLIGDRAKLVVGTGNNNFDLCLKQTKLARDLGADAALVVTPYYNKTTQDGLVQYYQKLAALKFPMIAYNVPARTGLMIELSTVEKLLQNPYIFGIKESTTDIARITQLCRICRDKIAVYSGEDDLNFLFYCLGANGSISVTANLFADKVEQVFQFVKDEKLEKARLLQDELSPLNKILFCETNPIPVKYLMSLKGLIEPDVRMPLVLPTKEHQDALKNFAEKM